MTERHNLSAGGRFRHRPRSMIPVTVFDAVTMVSPSDLQPLWQWKGGKTNRLAGLVRVIYQVHQGLNRLG